LISMGASEKRELAARFPVENSYCKVVYVRVL
jgi:hypothetical protein